MLRMLNKYGGDENAEEVGFENTEEIGFKNAENADYENAMGRCQECLGGGR